MRQDIAFTPGESVSQRHIARLLAQHFDAVITVDPHLHRIASLDEVMPAGRGVSLSAAGLLGAWAARQVRDVLLLGPDEESAPWVRCAARDGATAAGRSRSTTPAASSSAAATATCASPCRPAWRCRAARWC